MISHLVVYPRSTEPQPGRRVDTLRPAPNGEVPLTPFEARRLAAELVAAADAVEPPPPPTSKAPLGWNWRRGFVVDLREAEVIDALMDNYLSGLTHRQSADNLNARGLFTKYGKRWTKGNVGMTLHDLRKRGTLPRQGRPYGYQPPAKPDSGDQLTLAG